MARDSVVVETSINASIDVVWHCLTTDRGTWWPDMRFDAVVGAPVVETWIEDGRSATATGYVTQCAEPELLGFRWIEPRWSDSLDVAIRLARAGDGTSVTLAEQGFVQAQTPPSLPDEHEEGWTYHLTRLKRASEERSAQTRL